MIEARLCELNIRLPEAAPAMALYAPVRVHNGVAYLSGQLPRDGDRLVTVGPVGASVSLEDAKRGARLALIRGLAAMRHELGSLDRIESVLKLTVFVQSSPDFIDQSAVADGASELVYELLGKNGHHARSAIGVCQLPKNSSVEVEAIFAVRNN